jgi:hypothetical protein
MSATNPVSRDGNLLSPDGNMGGTPHLYGQIHHLYFVASLSAHLAMIANSTIKKIMDIAGLMLNL